MSWLTDARQQISQTDSQNTFIQNPNEGGQAPVISETGGLESDPAQELETDFIAPAEPEATPEPEAPQKSWLLDAKNQMEASVNQETLGDKGKRWLSDISDGALNQINDHNSVLWQGPEGVNEAMSSLAWTALTFNASIAAGAGTIAYEKLGNVLRPDGKDISPKGIKRKAERNAAWISGLVPEPKTDVGKAIIKPVGEFFHKLMKGPIKIGEDMAEYYGPNIGWLSEQALTLGLLKFMHFEGKELSKGVKSVIKKARPLGKKSAKMRKLEAELDSMIDDKVDSKATQKIIDQYEELVQSEYIVELENFQREKFRNRFQGPAILPKDIQKPGKIPEAPSVELPEAGKKILEFAQTASQMRKKASVKYPEVVSKNEHAKIDLAKIKKDSARRVRTKVPEYKPKPKPEVKTEPVAKEPPVKKSIMDTLKEKKPITEAAGKIEKQNLKDQVIKGVLSGEYKGAVRFTTASELKNAIIKGKFTPSKEYDAIHAQPIIKGLTKEDVSFSAYGDYTKHNVAILFPEKAVKTKLDAHTSEVLIDPKAKLEDARFFIGNQKKSFTYPELIAEMGKKPEVKSEPKPKPKPKPEPKPEVKTEPVPEVPKVKESHEDIMARKPDLKSTQDAYAWGEKATEAQIKDLEYYYENNQKVVAEIRKVKTLENLEEAGYQAQIGQFFREAIERNKNIGSAKHKVDIPEESSMDAWKKKPEVEAKPEPIKWRAQGKEFTSAVKADVEAAKDIGVYAEIKEQLGKGKTSTDIMTDLKKEEYYAQDMKDLKYTSRDMIEAIRAIDIIEHNNPKAIQRLKNSIEKKLIKRENKFEEPLDPGVKRVNPETGRKSGVEAPDRKVDLGTTDAVAAYRHRQAPIKLETGQIAKSKFMAEKSAGEQGLIGELVKDPESGGWLVRASKKQREASSKKLQSEWDEFLKDDKKVMEKKTEGEPVPDEPSRWSSLFDILKSERGAIDLDPQALGKIRDFIKSRKVSMRDARDLLLGKGLSQDQINKILIKSSSVQKTNVVIPDKESQWLKPGQNPNEVLPARVLKNGRKAPAVSRRDARIIEQTPDIGKPLLGEKVRHLATSDGIFTEIGKPIRELFYRKVVRGEKRSSDIGKELLKESNMLRKSLPLRGRYKSLQRIDNYAISKQPNGEARLIAQGVKIVKNLNAKELSVYNRLQAIYKDLYIKINRARKAVGLETFPPVENYSVWIHDMNKLKHIENISNHATADAFRKGMERVSKLPTKRDVKGRTVGFKGHEKFRGGPEVPGHLRLNALDNFNSYVLTASDILGKSEPIAYLHELLQPKFELYKNSNNTYNFLNEWLDYQKGIEPIMFVTNPKARRIMSKLSGNTAVSFITYAPKSAVVQFSSFNNSIAELGFPRMMRGIARLVNPEELRRAARESNILTTRTPESILMDAANSYPTLPGGIGRALHAGRKKVRNIGATPLSITDSIVSYSTWLEGEAKGKKIFKKSAEYRKMNSVDGSKALKEFSRNYADDMVVRAQGSAAKSARSPAQRTAEGKFITTLQTFTIANFDYLTRHVLGIKNPDITKAEQVGRAMNWVLASTLISKGFRSVGWSSPIPEPIRAYQEKLEQTGNKIEAVKEAAKELLEFLPVYGGKARYGSELAGVVTDQLVKLGKGDLTAVPRLMGIEGFSTMLKGYRAYKKDGTAADILMGRYIEKPKKSTGGVSGVGRIGGISGL